MTTKRFDNVWDAIADTPQEAENLRLRAELLGRLKARIDATGMSQAQAAGVFGVTQPRVSDLMRGKISLFSLDTLVNMAATAGMKINLHVSEIDQVS